MPATRRQKRRYDFRLRRIPVGDLYLIFQMLRDLVSRFQPTVVVTGPGATGKTALGAFLAGESIPPEYHQSWETEHKLMDDSWFKRLQVIPGQLDRVSNFFSGILDKNGKKALGLIYVVSYGHLTMGRTPAQAYDFYYDGMGQEEFFQAYQRESIEIEKETLRTLLRSIQGYQGDIWMVTACVKQDLWWDSRADVLKHYEHADGEFRAIIDEIAQFRDDRRFIHDFRPLSLIRRNLDVIDPVPDTWNQPLVETAAGFEYSTADKFRSDFLRLICERIDAR